MQAVQSISTGAAGEAPGKSSKASGDLATRIIKNISPIINELDDAGGDVAYGLSLVAAVDAMVENCVESYGVEPGMRRALHDVKNVLYVLQRQIDSARDRIEHVDAALRRAPGVEA